MPATRRCTSIEDAAVFCASQRRLTQCPWCGAGLYLRTAAPRCWATGSSAAVAVRKAPLDPCVRRWPHGAAAAAERAASTAVAASRVATRPSPLMTVVKQLAHPPSQS